MIHLILGNTGSGKTTYSNKLKAKTNGIIFSIDHWNKTLFLADKKSDDGLHWFFERIERTEEMILSLVHQLEEVNTVAILDLGLSKFEHREKFKKFAAKNDYELKLHLLNITKETRLKRILQRNEEKGETYQFEVTQENFNFMETWFEKPNSKEMIDGITINE